MSAISDVRSMIALLKEQGCSLAEVRMGMAAFESLTKELAALRRIDDRANWTTRLEIDGVPIVPDFRLHGVAPSVL